MLDSEQEPSYNLSKKRSFNQSKNLSVEQIVFGQKQSERRTKSLYYIDRFFRSEVPLQLNSV